MSRISEVLTISLPPKMAKAMDRIARQENKSKSELFRVAFLNYLEDKKRWQALRYLGEKTARKLKIKGEKDVEKLIDSIRR